MSHIKTEKTLVIIKSDGVQRSLIGEIMKRYERIGLKLVAAKFLIPSEVLIEKHYTIDPEWIRKVGEKSIQSFIAKNIEPPSNDPIVFGKKVLGRLVKYLSSGPVVAMVWQGAHAVDLVRKINGSTEPLTSDVGTIRGDFVLDSYKLADVEDRCIRNVAHTSGSNDEAENEIKLWFNPEEIIKYNQVQEKILYDVNLDGFLE